MKKLKNSKISFFIPVFNREKFVIDSLNSIIDDNYSTGDEIIVVDDASTDNTFSVLKKYANKNKKIKIKIIKNEKNIGAARSRNIAVLNSSNDLLFCLDSDNILKQKLIEKLKQHLLKTKSDIVSVEKISFFKKNIKTTTHFWKFTKENISLKDYLSDYLNPGSSGNYLFTKESFYKSGFYPQAESLDTWGFGLRQLAQGFKMSIAPSTEYFHRYGHTSNWSKASEKNIHNIIAAKLLIPYVKEFKIKFSDLENWYDCYLKKSNKKHKNGFIYFNDKRKNEIPGFSLLKLFKKKSNI